MKVPHRHCSDFIGMGYYRASEKCINDAKCELTQLTEFLNIWAKSATINILNILLRESDARNQVINSLNEHMNELDMKKAFVRITSTEKTRGLFSFRTGHRKNIYFSEQGSDNVHLNDFSIRRLEKHLKYVAHN